MTKRKISVSLNKDLVAELEAGGAALSGHINEAARAEQVRVLNTALRSGGRLLSRAEVLGRYGVHPWQRCDFRALTRDPADDIASVPGGGVKTAARLLAGGAKADPSSSPPQPPIQIPHAL